MSVVHQRTAAKHKAHVMRRPKWWQPHLECNAVAAIGPQKHVGTSEESLKRIRRQADSAGLESVQPGGDTDVESGEAGARKRDNIEQAEVTEILDEHHEQRQRAPHDGPAPSRRASRVSASLVM